MPSTLASRVANASRVEDLDYARVNPDQVWLVAPVGSDRVRMARGRSLLGPLTYSTLRSLMTIGLPITLNH